MVSFAPMRSLSLRFLALPVAAFIALESPALAQMPGGPPAVGFVVAAKKPITQVQEFIGRIEAVNRVNLVARVTAQLEETPFTEGAEVKKGDILYRLERPPFEALVDS